MVRARDAAERQAQPMDRTRPIESPARTPAERGSAPRIVSDEARATGAVPARVHETVREYSKRWLADRQVRVNSIRDDRGRMTHHILPILGSLDVCTFNRDDVERFRDHLDKSIERGFTVDAAGTRRTFSWKTAANCWTLLTSMAGDMVNAKKRDMRVRTDNPCRDVRAPERGGDKAKQYLYPSEFLRFVSRENVPLRWRRAVAVAVYTFLRDGELRAMRWQDGDVDLEHGVLSVTRAWNRRTKGIKETKTGHTRRFAIEPALLPLLEAMHEQKSGEGSVVAMASERAMARNLRRWLWKADVRRPELHEGSPTRKPLTWHDLRATGATWMAVRGDDPLKSSSAAGTRRSAPRRSTSVRLRRSARASARSSRPCRRASSTHPGVSDSFRIPTRAEGETPCFPGERSGVDGTRTRGLRRDRPAL